MVKAKEELNPTVDDSFAMNASEDIGTKKEMTEEEGIRSLRVTTSPGQQQQQPLFSQDPYGIAGAAPAYGYGVWNAAASQYPYPGGYPAYQQQYVPQYQLPSGQPHAYVPAQQQQD